MVVGKRKGAGYWQDTGAPRCTDGTAGVHDAEQASNASARAAKYTSAGAAESSSLASPEVRSTLSGRRAKQPEPVNNAGGTPAVAASKWSKQT